MFEPDMQQEEPDVIDAFFDEHLLASHVPLVIAALLVLVQEEPDVIDAFFDEHLLASQEPLVMVALLVLVQEEPDVIDAFFNEHLLASQEPLVMVALLAPFPAQQAEPDVKTAFDAPAAVHDAPLVIAALVVVVHFDGSHVPEVV